MSRFARIRRRPDHWSSPHERARIRAAERMDGPLGLAEATWLDEHLADCAACSTVAAAYESDRQALRTDHGPMPVPPRDLWARTAAAIEQEATAHGRRPAATPRSRSRLPLGALSGLAVVAVVLGLSAVSSGLLFNGAPVGPPSDGGTAASTPSVASASGGAVAVATPIAVGAGDVAYLVGDGGRLVMSNVGVDEVCGTTDPDACGTLADPGARQVQLAAAPKAIIRSPSDPNHAVVVGSDTAGTQTVTVFALPSETPAPTPIDTPSASPSVVPSETPVATTAPSSAPSPTPDVAVSPSPTPIGSIAASVPPSGEPSASPPATPTPAPTDAATASPTAAPTVQPSATPAISGTPEPTAAAIAIASGVEVVGESAAFSADGQWFAFTARPGNGTGGPDIWVWHVGDPRGRQVTTDGMSIFASWDGDTVVGSQVGGDTAGGGPAGSRTFTMDPATGRTEDITTPGSRPVIDPTGRFAVVWVADSATTGDPAGPRHLELQRWSGSAGSPSSTPGERIADAPVADFDVRWDEQGEWFGVWVADTTDAAFGRLTLFHLDRATGRLTPAKGGPVETPALAGISVGDGRMAWATPAGQGGEGSRVQIAAWKDGAVGTVETVPAGDVLVVR